MQYMDDTFTTVPDWFVKYYESGLYLIGYAVMGMLVIVLLVAVCRLYFQLKEIQRFLDKK